MADGTAKRRFVKRMRKGGLPTEDAPLGDEDGRQFAVVVSRKRKLQDEVEPVEDHVAKEAKDSAAAGGKTAPAKPRPHFPPLKRARLLDGEHEMRKIAIPAHRRGPLKEHWLKIFTPIVQHLLLQIRYNLRTKHVELRNSNDTKDNNALQKGADFIRAFTLGIDVDDAVALLRLDELFIDTFQIQDVKPLKGPHVARAIGRIAGKRGKTRFTIENVTKTRIVVANTWIHIMGSYQNIAIARRAISNLILGSPPSKIYGTLRTIASRVRERL